MELDTRKALVAPGSAAEGLAEALKSKRRLRCSPLGFWGAAAVLSGLRVEDWSGLRVGLNPG